MDSIAIDQMSKIKFLELEKICVSWFWLIAFVILVYILFFECYHTKKDSSPLFTLRNGEKPTLNSI